MAIMSYVYVSKICKFKLVKVLMYLKKGKMCARGGGGSKQSYVATGINVKLAVNMQPLLMV